MVAAAQAPAAVGAARRLRGHRPGPDLAGPPDAGGDAHQLAGRRLLRVRSAAGRGVRAALGRRVPGGRFQPVHTRLRQRRPAEAVAAGLRRRGHRARPDRAPDRLPAHPLRGLQPPRSGGHPAPGPGGGALLGPGDPGPAVAGRHRDGAAGAVPGVGAAGLGHGREPLDLSRAADLPLPAPAPQLAGGAGRRDGRGGAPARPGPEDGATGGPSGAAGRLQRPARHRTRGAHPLRRRPLSRGARPAHLRRVRRGRGDAGRGRFPRRTHPAGGLAPLPRLAGQLRGRRLRTVPPLRRGTGPVDGPPRLPDGLAAAQTPRGPASGMIPTGPARLPRPAQPLWSVRPLCPASCLGSARRLGLGRRLVPLLRQHPRQHGPLQRQHLGVQGAALGSEGDPHPAAVLRAHRAFHQAVLLQTADQPGQRALAEMHPADQVLHPAVITLVGRLGGQDVQHLEVAGPQPVGGQCPVYLAHRARVHGEDVPPPFLQPGVGRLHCHTGTVAPVQPVVECATTFRWPGPGGARPCCRRRPSPRPRACRCPRPARPGRSRRPPPAGPRAAPADRSRARRAPARSAPAHARSGRARRPARRP
ncbi:putative GH13_26 / GH13 / GH13_20 [Streptomyces misionensis JCM 4497]